MKRFLHSFSRREKAQTMIEFALVFPVLLLLLYGIIEFGRLLFIYTAVTTSSREAARYGSAVGNVGNTPRYLDCAGILGAAQRSAILTPLNTGDLTITYDHGPSTTLIASSCADGQGKKFVLGDRIIVQVTVDYTPLMPLVNFASFPIISTTARTILRTVEVLGTPAPNSSQPYIYFEVSSQSGTETDLDTDEKTIYAVLSSVSSSPVTVFFSYAGTATRDQDYTGIDSLVFAPGQKRLAVARVKNDPYDEWDETVEIKIETANGAIIDENKNTHTTTILDTEADDPMPVVQFMYAQQDVFEPQPFEDQAIFIITVLSELSGKDISVPFTYSPYTVNTDAQYGVDYTLVPATLTFAFPAMAGTTQQIMLLATKDGLDEEDAEDAWLTLGTPTNATLGSPLADHIRVLDIDEPPNVSFDLASQMVVEGVTVKLKVVLEKITTKVVTVAFTATDIEAIRNVDYTIDTPSPVTIPAGSLEAEISITILTDDPLVVEMNERFEIDMTTVTNATPVDPKKHTMTIAGIAEQPIVNFEGSKSASEGAGVVQIRFVLDHVWNKAVTVPYSIIGGTAVNGVDYTASAGTVTIPIGSLYGSFTVNLIDDSMDEDNETIIFAMGAPTNATQGPTTQHVLTIADNDDAPFVNFELASQLGMEDGGPLTARVLLSAISSKTVTVPFTVGGTSTLGTEHTVTASPVTIPAGSTSVNIVITVIDDTIPGEGNETVILTLGSPANGQLGGQPVHTATIKDDDLCPSLATRDIQPNSGRNYIVIGMLYPDATQPTIWITDVFIEWNNGGSQKLDRVDWIGTPIWEDKNGINTAPLDITTFIDPQSNRNYAPSAQERLLVVYFRDPLAGAPGDYSVTVTFNNQCTVP